MKLNGIKIARKEHILGIAQAYLDDQYDDSKQRTDRKLEDFHDPDLLAFVERNQRESGFYLEIGCGCGDSFHWLPITHAVEPNPLRAGMAEKEAGETGVEFEVAFAEALPYEESFFNTVVSLGTWHYLRSQLEGFIEVNRVLKIGGVFIVDIYGGRKFPYGGISMDADGLLSGLGELGFALVEKRLFMPYDLGHKENRVTGLALEKVFDFEYSCLNKLQITDQGTLNNYLPARDNWLL